MTRRTFYALLVDVGPDRGTVLDCGSAAEVWGAYYSTAEPCSIWAAPFQVERGERVWHHGEFEHPDALYHTETGAA
jgi:hypothetical protein